MQKLQLTKKYNRYPEYKDSGVEWLGEIPAGWEMRKIFHLFKKIGSGMTPEDVYLTEDETGIPWVNTGDLSDSFVEYPSKRVKKEALEKYSALKLYPKGSLIIAMYGATIGKLGVVNFDFCSNQACCILENPGDSFSGRYIYFWLLGHKKDIVDLGTGGGQPNINKDIVKSLKVSLPKKEEQTKIAAYLDEKVSVIDRTIEGKKKLIDLLREKRTAVINDAVTKGLNKNVELVESGVDWIGKIPKGWKIEKMKFLAKRPLQYGANESAIDDDILNPRFIRITDIDESGNLREETFKSLTKEIARPYLLEDGDILFARTGATVGKTFKYKKEWGTCCYAGYLIRMNVNKEKISSDYLKYVTEADYYWKWINSIFIKSTIQNVSAEKYKEFLVAVPPKKEQDKITEYLDKMTKNYDEALKLAEKSIATLQEFKSSLISNVVTGKVKV